MGRKAKDVQGSSIGARMRLVRLEKGISLTDMAKAIGYTKSRLSTVENGSGNPSQELVRAYEEMLALEPDSLSGFTGKLVLPKRTRPLEYLDTSATTIETITTQTPLYSTQTQTTVDSVLHESSIAYRPTLPTHDRTLEFIDDAPKIGNFYGREQELRTLEQWIIQEQVRICPLLGIGGIGKTTLASVIKDRLKAHFDFVYWRTLQNAPTLEEVLKECIYFLSEQSELDIAEERDEQIKQVMYYLRAHRCLLVLDNIETILQGGQSVGSYRPGYEGYGALIAAIGEQHHQSTLVITTRELPLDVTRLEGPMVQTLQLQGVGQAEGREILRERGLEGSDSICNELVQTYTGNPLALKLVAAPIRELFGGNIAEFLSERGTVVGDIYDLIDRQFRRLSALEREIIYWFALACEPISLNEVLKKIIRPVPKRELLDALDSLRRRSMIESSSGTLFRLQPVIMEYVTDEFVQRVSEEIQAEQFNLLTTHALIKAEAKDHVRNNQVRLFLEPVARQLLTDLGKVESEHKLRRMLDTLRNTRPQTPEYSAGNLLNLLVQLKVDLTGYDFSNLVIWNAYVQDVALPNVNFAQAHLEHCIFTDTFGSILALDLSANGELLAAGTANGEVRLWRASTSEPLGICQGHTDWVRSVEFSPDGHTLISGGDDQVLRLWDIKTMQCLKTFYGHTNRIRSVAFSPDGKIVASGSDDHTIRIWDTPTGECLATLQGHTSRIWSVAFSPDGRLIASGSSDQTLKLWDLQRGNCIKDIQGVKDRILSVAFSPDGRFLIGGGDDQIVSLWDLERETLLKQMRGHTSRIWSVRFSTDGQFVISGSDDQSIRLWKLATGECITTLRGHTNRVWSVAFSPDGNTIVSGSDDQSIRMWNTNDGLCIKTLQGHSSRVRSVAFSPDGANLISGSDDKTVRVWETATGHCLKTLQGHSTWIYSVAFSPKGTIVASGSDDQTIRLWDVNTGYCLLTLGGHSNWVRSVAFSPDGANLVSGSDDQTVRIWQVKTGLCLSIVQQNCSRIWSVAFSPDGAMVACGGEDKMVRVWHRKQDEHPLFVLQGHDKRVRSVSFSPDGRLLASSSDDSTIRIWELESGRCVNILRGHTQWVWSVAFSPDGQQLVSGGDDQSVRLWQVEGGQQLWAGYEHSHRIYSVAFSPTDRIIASGSYDGTIKLWETETGKCLRTLRRERPYENMNIIGVTGLSPAQKAMLRTLGAIEL